MGSIVSLQSLVIFVPFLILFPLLLAKRTTPFAGSLLGVGVGVILAAAMGIGSLLDIPQILATSSGLLIQVLSILLGAFFFVTCSEKSGILASLMEWLSASLIHRGQRLFLIGFAVSLVFEGGGGFGTPLFLVMPLLLHDRVPSLKAAVTPLMAACIGVPFGALGVPVLVGFSSANPQQVGLSVAPWLAVTAIPVGLLIARNLAGRSLLSRTLLPWVLLVIAGYSGGLLLGIRFSTSIPTLLGGLCALLLGIATAKKERTPMKPQAISGAWIYGGLLITLLITRALNLAVPPFFIFLLFGVFAVLSGKTPIPIQATLSRCWRTIAVVTSWILWISVSKHFGWITQLGQELPRALTTQMSPVTGFLGSLLFGSATFSNLLMSPITDPRYHGLLAYGSALGTTLTLQSSMVLQSLSPTRIRYADIAKQLIPVFISGLVIWSLALIL
jgi:L-lactate permease